MFPGGLCWWRAQNRTVSSKQNNTTRSIPFNVNIFKAEANFVWNPFLVFHKHANSNKRKGSYALRYCLNRFKQRCGAWMYFISVHIVIVPSCKNKIYPCMPDLRYQTGLFPELAVSIGINQGTQLILEFTTAKLFLLYVKHGIYTVCHSYMNKPKY